MQRQTAVASYFSSNLLLLFVLARQIRVHISTWYHTAPCPVEVFRKICEKQPRGYRLVKRL